MQIFISKGRVRDNSLVWQAQIPRKELKAIYLSWDPPLSVVKTFRALQGLLYHTELSPIVVDRPLTWIIAGMPNKKKHGGNVLAHIANLQDVAALTKCF